MPATKRAPIYLDPALHDALREKAVEAQTSISDIVNEVVRRSLADYEEEAEDLAELDRLRKEPNIPFEEVVADLKRRSRL
jgi:CRISPR/Cas system-associated protein Csm6